MIEAVVDCQQALIDALDAGDADAIHAASDALAMAVARLSDSDKTIERGSLEHGLKQAEAARIRVKYLTAWNRQKLDRLSVYRGLEPANAYSKPRQTAIFEP